MTDRIGNTDVSRETFEKLTLYVEILKKWNPRINLVSKSSIEELWNRHFVDSAQVFSLMPQGAVHWVDIGSGGGFPGMIIAILAAELAPELRVTLVESDKRKCEFLRTVSRETKCKVSIIAGRVEEVKSLQADVLSARALADLNLLINFAKPHLAGKGCCIFPKGHTWKKELKQARESWRFSIETFSSETQASAVILRINEIEHV